jgi:phage terminase large subunit
VLDPVTFQRQFLLRKLWAKQQELVRALRTQSQVAVKGCHGSGKTYACAGMVPYELTAYQESIVLVTAPTLRQVKTFWREITEAIATSRIRYPEPTTTMWELSPRRYAQGFSSTKGVNAQGFHGKRVTILADEAIGISSEIWDAIEGIRSAGDVRLVMLCNPTVPSGPVFDAFSKLRGTPGHATISISAFNTPNLSGLTMESLLQLSEEDLDYAPFPWLIRRRWVKEMYHKWGPNNPRFLARVLGEFPSQSQWAVFSLEWLEHADREPTEAEIRAAAGHYIQVGLDVAAGGDDETAACARVDGIVLARESWSEADPRGKVAAWLYQLRKEHRYPLGPIVVDVVGVGYGMGLHLADCGFSVVGFRAGGEPMDKEQFLNAKAEAYFRLREAYKCKYVSHLPGALDEDTKAQLSAVEYRDLPRGQIQVEPKEEARKRGVQSPDRAEAEVMAFCRVVPRQQTVVYAQPYQISVI